MTNSNMGKNTHQPNEWKSRLMQLLKEFLSVRSSSKKRYNVSVSTNQKRKDIILLCFTQLRADGYKVQDAHSIKPKHIQHLMSRWEGENLSISVLTNRLSVIRLFTEFNGKLGMVGSVEDYVSPDYLTIKSRVPKKIQSVGLVEIDTQAIIKNAMEIDPYTGHQLKLMLLFGLRAKEAIYFCPFKSDYKDYLLIMHGTKARRTRPIQIDTPEKILLMDDCKKLVGSVGANMCNPKRSKTQEMSRLYYVMRLLGITRAQLGITPQELRQKQEVPVPNA